MMISTPLPDNYCYLTLPAMQMNTATIREKPAEDLLLLLLQKSEKGFSRLYDNYADALFSVIYQVTENKEIAEDLLQESFVKIWKKIDSYDKTKGTLYTWMLNIARNTAIDFIRLRRNKFHKQLVHGDVWQHENFQTGTDTGNADRLDYLAIKNKAASLDDKYAVIIDLIYFEGFTYIQAAKQLKMPLSTVKTRARMALSLLKKAYNEYRGNY
jgi:RNA polymerase sigma-70 factor, ECF subfamily